MLTLGRLSVFTLAHLSQTLDEGRGRRSLRSRLRTVTARIVFHKRRALAGRPAKLRYRRMTVEGRGPTIQGGLRTVPPSRELRFFAIEGAQPGTCQVAGGNPEGAASSRLGVGCAGLRGRWVVITRFVCGRSN